MKRNIPPDAFAYESLTVTNAAIGFTAATYAPAGATGAARAIITAETAQMRARWDGVDPTTSEGHLLEIGDTIVIEGLTNITAFRAIRTGSTSGVLKVTFER